MEEILDKYFVKLVYTKHDQCYYTSDDYGFSNSNSDSEDEQYCCGTPPLPAVEEYVLDIPSDIPPVEYYNLDLNHPVIDQFIEYYNIALCCSQMDEILDCCVFKESREDIVIKLVKTVFYRFKQASCLSEIIKNRWSRKSGPTHFSHPPMLLKT